jgi:glyoxylase-like metal-dependent hydrolase (beta-lactamase superfamily II)
MRISIRAAIVASFTLATVVAMAQEEPVEVRELADHLYLLSTDQGSYTTNTIALVGDDGVLLVDTQDSSDAAYLKEAVDEFGKGIPKYIINTHRHVEHIGGNAIFGEEPIVIAHELVPKRLKSGSYIFDEFPEATFPDITLSDSLTLHFNGERIEIHALPGSHDDNEIIVHFTRSKVVHLSSLVNGFNFPSVDSQGDVLKFADCVVAAMELLPEDVTIVSGHNDVGTWDDLRAYHDMLTETTEILRAALADGKDVEKIQSENLLGDWERYAGSYVSLDRWVEYLAEGLQRSGPSKERAFVPLYEAWKRDGAAAAIELYRSLMRDHPDEYLFDDATLRASGSKLLGNSHHQAAIVFLEANLQLYPESDLTFYTNYLLARAHNELGERELAVQYCEEALELNPEFTAATTFLEELKRLHN